ncbi:hypothetical protein J6590_047481 [Homalodisca vitripennis]|nr:hypothetical protein J6590_047481 [Homalodisca vitripennis]
MDIGLQSETSCANSKAGLTLAAAIQLTARGLSDPPRYITSFQCRASSVKYEGVPKSNRNCIAGSRQRVVHIPAARRVAQPIASSVTPVPLS